MKITKPSTLRALLDGDIANAVISETPGGIEQQEKDGQTAFVASESMPIETNSGTWEQLIRMGVKPLGDMAELKKQGELFVNVELPAGWKTVATDHSMWSKLLDDKGRERASIFYKAAFYDRSAFVNVARRFAYLVEPVGGYEQPNFRSKEWHCVVTDAGKIIWQSEKRVEPEPPPSATSKQRIDWYNKKTDLYQLGEVWLKEHYSNWQDPTAYWN